MIGQGSPRIWPLHYGFLLASLKKVRVASLCAFVCFASCVLFTSQGSAEEQIVRLRFAWGNSSSTKMRWNGQIKVENAKLASLQPLGVESDAPVSLQIQGDRVLVVPRLKRGFEGCDITVQADSEALVSIELQAEQAPHMTRIQVPLSDITYGEVRQPIDELGSYVVAHRAPGDKLRVQSVRQNYVFNSNELWNLSILPDLEKELSVGPILLEAQLSSIGGNVVLWSDKKLLKPDSQPTTALNFEIPCPAEENAYRLTLFAHHEEGFATRFVPGKQTEILAQRNINIVVIDPLKKLPKPSEAWQSVLTIDPANPHWWQRLPAWARVPGLRDKMQGSLGNVRPLVRSTEIGELVELPAADGISDPHWQSYTLPVQDTGVMHKVEIEYPSKSEHHLSINIVEPDAAGRVLSGNLDTGFYSVGTKYSGDGDTAIHQFVFWPRTNAPQLLMVNRYEKGPAQYGKIRLFRQPLNQTEIQEVPETESQRMVASYISEPNFVASFGAEEVLDQASGLSVQGWSTFLQGANRLVQYLRYSGQNTVMLSVAAEGSAIYPSEILNPSPRFDTGLLAADGQDPQRKDILEMLLRICDREGIRVIPTVQLTSLLPRLEQLVHSYDPQSVGFVWIGRDGKRLSGNDSESACHYNLLNSRVQQEIDAMLAELVLRYAQHPSFTGTGLQMSGNSYGTLPGLEWGFDDATITRLTEETGLSIQATGPERFSQRASQLLGEQRDLWKQWRVRSVTAFYNKLAQGIRSSRNDLNLFLATEALFAGPASTQKLCHSLANTGNLRDILVEQGIDVKELESLPGVHALQPIRVSSNPGLKHNALDLRLNTAYLRGELSAETKPASLLLYHSADSFHLASFDKQSPFGADKTFLKVQGGASPAGYAQRQQLIAQLARKDVHQLFVGGDFLSMSRNQKTRQVLKAIEKLPAPESLVKSLDKQPVVMRVYRTDYETSVVLINESPWPLQLRLPLDAAQQYAWEQLGASSASGSGHGFFAPGTNGLEVQLEPYDLQAWRFDTCNVRVSEPEFSQAELAKQDLLERIKQIESRTANLDIERPYPQLQNPGFELQDGTTRIVGWQHRLGSHGSVSLINSGTHHGGSALKMLSKEDQAVAIQSHLFPMPETGQLMVSAYLRAENWSPEAQLQISIEDGTNNPSYRQYTVLGSEQPIQGEWARYDFPVNDIPLNSKEQLRVRFHLTGDAELLVDDVQLCDLRFDDELRNLLVKQIFAAKTALDLGNVVDCLQVVDEYWSRYLVEHVPPRQTEPTLVQEPEPVSVAAKPTQPQKTTPPEEKKGFGERMRGWVPRIWR